MIDYIEIPKIVTKNEFYSNSLKELIRNEIDEKVNLDYLRNIYKKDVLEFIKLSQELSFRGCIFKLQNPNNLLQNLNFSDVKEYIFVKENKSRYKEINFDKYKLGDLVGKYKISDDRFFNFVPIEGFKVFNRDINIDELKEDLIKCGFNISSILEIEDILACESEEKTKNENIISEKYIDKNENLQHNGNLEKQSILLIEDYFSENTFNSFRDYAKKINIYNVDEIDEQTIEGYAKCSFLGTKKITNIRERLKLIKNNEYTLIIEEEKINEIHFDNIEDTPIEKVFFDSYYGLFISFCKNEGIYNLGDINDEILDKFANSKGVGIKRVKVVKELLNKYITIDKENLNYDFDEPIFIEDRWIELLKNVQILDIAQILDLPWELGEEYTLSNIQGNTLEQLSLTDKNYKQLIAFVKKLNRQKHINEIFTESKKILKENYLKSINLRYENGYTLEQAGTEMNLTRERVRQIVAKGINKLNNNLKVLDIEVAMKLNFYGKSFCTMEEFYKLSGDDNLVIAKAIINKNELFSICKSLDIIYFENLEELELNINKIINSLPTVFKFYDQLDEIIEMLSVFGIGDIDIEKIEQLLELNGYIQYGEYFAKFKLNYLDIFEIIFRDHINEPMYLDESSYEKLVRIYKVQFDLILDNGLRSTDARIRDVENIVLVNKRTFLHIDKLNIEQSTIDRVNELVSLELMDKSTVSAQFILAKYYDELSTIGIENKYLLYSVVTYYLSHLYKTGKGNTLDISNSLEELKQNIEEKILELIYINNGKISKDEILEITEWPQTKLDNTISKSKKLIKVSNYVSTIEYLGLNENLRKIIDDAILRELDKNGFLISTILYNNLVIIPEVYDFFNKNNITKGEYLSTIAKHIMPKLRGNTQFLYLEGSKFKNFNDVIVDRFPEIFTKDELKEILENFGFKGKTLTSFINDMIYSDSYIKISADEYICSDLFNIEEDIIEELIEFIEEKFGDKEYLSLNTLTGFKRKLPSIDYSWNIYLIESILTKHGYRKIGRTFFDTRTERLILVRETSKFVKFDELIYYILKNEYKGIMHETKIYDFLCDIGVIFNPENRSHKKIPFDLYKSDKFIIDEFGRVDLV